MIHTYAPGSVHALIGVVPLTTFNKITVETEDRNKLVQGIYGELSRVKKRTVKGTVTIDMPQTSNLNLLMGLNLMVGGVIPLGIIDTNGISLHVMPKGVILRMPTVVYGKSLEDRQWVIQGAILVNVVSGTSIIDSVTADLFK
jgi:hypothetical protein